MKVIRKKYFWEIRTGDPSLAFKTFNVIDQSPKSKGLVGNGRYNNHSQFLQPSSPECFSLSPGSSDPPEKYFNIFASEN